MVKHENCAAPWGRASIGTRSSHAVSGEVSRALANFTILADNPVTIDPIKIRDITVWGTVQEGRVLPVNAAAARAAGAALATPWAGPETGGSPDAADDDQWSYRVALHVINLAGHAH